nr:hypothetical protein [Tanacetum cinerariifolium]
DGDDEPFDDDDDDDDIDDEDEDPFEDEEDDEKEEEHLDPADSFVVPIIDLVLPTGLRRARNTVRLEPPMSASMEACIARHVALLLPPLPVPSLPLPLPLPLTTSPTDTEAPLGYRAAGIRMRALLPSTSRRTNIPEADVSPQKRACLTTLAFGFEIGESSAADAAGKPGPIESDHRRYWDLEPQVVALITQTSSLQTQLTTALGRIKILEARDQRPRRDQLRLAAAVSLAPFIVILYSTLSFIGYSHLICHTPPRWKHEILWRNHPEREATWETEESVRTSYPHFLP